MGEILQKRLKMSGFESPVQEALLALLVAASELRANMDRTLSEAGACMGAGITGEQFNILRILRGARECGGHPCGEIADRMIDRSPDITRRIDTLEKQGYVERERSAEDKRVVIVRITPKGQALLDSIAPKLIEYQNKIAAKLNEQELKQLSALCERLLELEDESAEVLKKVE
jgi:DNA-binding MarR family transcriptional regulator